jgi:hypothetical protein
VFELVASAAAGLRLDRDQGVAGGEDPALVCERIRLQPCTAGISDGGPIGGWAAADATLAGEKFPHVRAAGHTCLRLPRGRALQGEPMKPRLKPPGTEGLKLKCDKLLSM